MIGAGSWTLSACNNEGNEGSCGSPGACYNSSGRPDPSGVYRGVLTENATQQSTSVLALFAENGDARMSGGDGTYYHFHLKAGDSGDPISGSYDGIASSPVFPDGSRNTRGTLALQVAPGERITGTLTDGSGDVETLSLTFNTVYQTGSALAALAGNWSASTPGVTFSISIQPNGAFTGTDAKCAYSGVFDLIDPQGDVYALTFARTCGSVSDANFTGLATEFPAFDDSPALLYLLADDGAGDALVVNLQ